MHYVLGVDIGGTFTDCVVVDDSGKVTIGKSLSTPEDFSIGAMGAIRDAATKLSFSSEDGLIPSIKLFFHACTIGDNTLITRSGAKTGLIATKGFGDTILMMRGKTTDGLSETEAAHLSALSKPEPIVPRSLIEEINERIDNTGSIIVALDQKEAEKAVETLIEKGIESLAVCLLWSIANAAHEKIVAETVREKDSRVFLSISSDVAPFMGEYERTATAVFNAYIGPKISSYLINLQKILKSKSLPGEPLIMQAYGGVLSMDSTCKNAVGTIESGPAAGVVGSQFLGNLIGEKDILATDMGGTTFKVSVIRNGLIERDYKPVIQRHTILSTKIWVESVGAGGGSIAWVDPETGLLKVGPGGAGSQPGPVCYRLGGKEPTVSDADLVLGYLNENYFLAGRMTLDSRAASSAIEEKIASPLGISVTEAANGIYRIANSHMSDLVRKATVEKGYDPRNFVLFAFGGAGPVHASKFAAELGIKRVIIPLTASVHGATGLITSDVTYEYGKSDHLLVPTDADRVNANFSSLVTKALLDLRSAGFEDSEIQIMRSFDMRYQHQVHELNVPLSPGISDITNNDLHELYASFDTLYEQSYGPGSGYREAGKEIITFRVAAKGKLPKPTLQKERTGSPSSKEAIKGKRNAYFHEYGEYALTPLYDFDCLKPGNEIQGPAIIETPVTTIVINPTDRAVMDEFRNIRILLRI